MSPSDFATADIDKVLDNLTTAEAILLSAGMGPWHSYSVDRLGIPAIKFSDGPNGVRGRNYFMGTRAKCLPSATALGATWDTALVEEVGLKIMAEEAKLRAVSSVNGPTCNIQRNPLGGRSFESFSEDPFLCGMMAASYVNGVQKGGIGTAIKHFVANDKEDDRKGYDSVLSARALREIYLMPFMLAQKHAQPWSFMTAYNRVNGPHVVENPFLLKNVLRDEWKFDGMIVSDWFGTYDVDHALNAGLDLEMPGINKWRTLEYVNRSIEARKLTITTIKQRVKKLLELIQKCARGAPEVLDGDGRERSVDTEDEKILMRKVASESIVLLRNEGDILPLNPQKLKKIAVIGPNAKASIFSGGGSAVLKTSYFINPYEGIVSALEQAGNGTEVVYSEGSRAYKTMPLLDYDLFTESGERGWIGNWHKHVDDDSLIPLDEVLETRLIDETRVFFSTSVPEGITKIWTMKLRGYLKPRPYDCTFEFGLMVAGRAKLFVDDQLVIDNWTRQRRGDAFFGCGSQEEKGTFQVKANTKHEIYIVFCNVHGPADGDEDEAVMDHNAGLRFGGAEVRDLDDLLQEAVDLAKDADSVIAIVGLDNDWEAEGYDRTSLDLPGRTNELIARVAAVNPNIVVVTQAGSAITMPWVASVPAIVHVWYLGNASGDAIADVLFGRRNPSGKLSLTFPKAEEDVPSYGHFNSENGKVRYAEDLYVGYKHYQHRKIAPLFAFGHGLSYSKFSLSNLQLSEVVVSGDEFSLAISLTVENIGCVTGSEVVQVYTSLPTTSELTHPLLQLKGFAKVRDLVPGSKERVQIVLDKYAVSYWNDIKDAWIVEQGVYRLEVGTGSDCLSLGAAFEVTKTFDWSGL